MCSFPDTPEPNTTTLLWVNKDASNLHSKKHVTEVNAHVQKRGSRRRTSRKSNVSRSISASSRGTDGKIRRRSTHSLTPDTVNDGEQQLQIPSPEIRQRDSTQFSPPALENERLPTLESEYSSIMLDTPVDYDTSSLWMITQLMFIQEHIRDTLLQSLDTVDFPAATASELSDHDQLLMHIYLTHVPENLFSLETQAIHRPTRPASTADISKDSLGLLWVLISLDMFLTKVRGTGDHDELLLQSKNRAYKLMAKRLANPVDSSFTRFVVGTGSAALAELYFGDSGKAIMHLGAVETMIESNGGTDAIVRLPPVVTVPLLGAFAYRTVLHDGLKSSLKFDCAHRQFLDNIRYMIVQNTAPGKSKSGDYSPHKVSQLEKDVGSSYVTSDTLSLLRFTKQQRLAPMSLIRSFIELEFCSSGPFDTTDQFVLLYSMNLALDDFGDDYCKASDFLEEAANDIQIAGLSTDTNHPLTIAGARNIFVQRYVQTGSKAIARAWQSIDGLEILKLLSAESRAKIHQTLFGFLTLDGSGIISLDELDAIGVEASSSWWERRGTASLP